MNINNTMNNNVHTLIVHWQTKWKPTTQWAPTTNNNMINFNNIMNIINQQQHNELYHNTMNTFENTMNTPNDILGL